MALDRDDLAARATAARAALLSLCEALSALVPVAPASGAPATEPYRGADCLNMIGAVIDYYGQAFIVTSHGCSQLLGHPNSLACGHATPSAITFSRWATREECERHGIPYVARPLPGAPLAAPSRPEWVPKVGERVRVTRDNANHASVKAGDEYVVTSLGWDPYPETEAWGCGTGGTQYVRVCNLEPCAAPSPAATPAAWVPSVGDVVTIDCPDNALVYHEWWHGSVGVVEKAPEWLKASKYQIRVKYAPNYKGRRVEGWDDVPLNESHVRPATPSERAAAGLPVDESATKPVDREGLAGAIWRSFNDESPDRRFDTIGVYERESYLKAADAVVAFMAKRGAS